MCLLEHLPDISVARIHEALAAPADVPPHAHPHVHV
jgi:hypothetical protein